MLDMVIRCTEVKHDHLRGSINKMRQRPRPQNVNHNDYSSRHNTFAT